MKQKTTITLAAILITLFSNCFASTPNENNSLSTDNKADCYSAADRQIISDIITSKSKKNTSLNFNNAEALADVTFIWPIRQEDDSFPIYNTRKWVITNYVDHNSNSNAIQDYNCGTNTYDGHKGTDIRLWPFQWAQMDSNQTSVIAAASGKIIRKTDGNFDKNCSLISGSNWNAIYLEHVDGSISYYGHLKTGTLTSKNVDDTVEEGEFLGNVGSSGYSTAPHLHFEVYDPNGNLIDPFSGSCNDSTSKWENQEDYLKGKVLTVYTHDDEQVLSDCYGEEEPNIEDTFNPNDLVYFAGYFSNLKASDTVNFTIMRPNGTIFKQWSQVMNKDYQISYWTRTYILDDSEGTWLFAANYENTNAFRNFYVVRESCSNAISNLPHTESFENTFANWEQSSIGLLDWALKSGSTPSGGTGPTSASTGSNYAYIEASVNGTGYPFKKALLTSPCIDLSNNPIQEFSFDYHMYDSNDSGASLIVELSEDFGITWKELWSTTGNKGNQWLNQKINISSSTSNEVLIRFNGRTGNSWSSDIAIDNLNFKSSTSSTKSVTALSEENLELNTLLKVYPTPLKGNLLNVSLNGNIPKNYLISTTSGKIIMEGVVTETIDLESLTPGFYFISVQNQTTKLIKE